MKASPINFNDFDSSCLNTIEDLKQYNVLIDRDDNDNAETCPVSLKELTDYIKLENSLEKVVKLSFIRTAKMNGFVYWLWRYKVNGVSYYATVDRAPDGQITMVTDNMDNMTPEQYLLYVYCIVAGYPLQQTTFEHEKIQRKNNFSKKKKSSCTMFNTTRNVYELTDKYNHPDVTYSQQKINDAAILKAGEQWDFSINGIVIAFRWCPPGDFMMGRSADLPYPGDDLDKSWLKLFRDESYHHVVLTKGFWMMETPVTQEIYQCVMSCNPSHFSGLKHPVESVSWYDCVQFINALNKVVPLGYLFALPTEAQWEYACRAGTESDFGTGKKLSKKAAIFERARTADVRKGQSNQWGLYDMHGNVLEWCSDWYQSKYSKIEFDPTGPKEGEYKVLRGGDWGCMAEHCRSSARHRNPPDVAWDNYGFRIVMEKVK